MGTLFFLGFHYIAGFNTEYDFVIFCFLLSLDTLSGLKLFKILRGQGQRP